MKKYAVAMPFPTAHVEEFKQFGDQVAGPRLAEHTASRAALGITDERCWLQSTPSGERLLILLLAGRDPEQGNRRFAASTEPYDVWFKQTASAITGLDFDQPIPIRPELKFESVPAGADPKLGTAMALPLLDTDAWLSLVAEVNGPRRAAHAAFHERVGVTEDWYFNRTPVGDVTVVYLHSPDLSAAIAGLAASHDEHDEWFKRQLLAAEGVDWNSPPPGPAPELVLSWQAP